MATQTRGISFWTFKAQSEWGNIIQWGRTCSHVRFPLSKKGTFQVLPRMSLVRTKLDDILVCMRNPPTHPGAHSFEYLVLSWLCVWTVGEDCRSFRSWRLGGGSVSLGQALRFHSSTLSFSSLYVSLLPVSHEQLGSCYCFWDAK